MSDFSLNHPPLICVAARVQFMPVEKISAYISELQEALRLAGYPHFEEQRTKVWQIDDRAEAGMNVSFQEISRWDFANLEKTVTIRVDRESLTLLFTDYDHFSNAEPHYRTILKKVEEKIPSLLPQLVQLRYIACIPLPEGASPTDWVTPSVLGMPNLDRLQRLGSVSETSFLTPEGGQFVTRCMSLGPQGLTLPADLLPLNAKLKHPLQSETPFLLLENLHQRQAEVATFAAESCLTQLSSLRAQNAEVFQATVTPQALESWK